MSPAFGFTWDSSSMANQITACNNVVSQYDAALRWGTLNPDETLDQFNAELEAAGINENHRGEAAPAGRVPGQQGVILPRV